jgi:hypothetical protein
MCRTVQLFSIEVEKNKRTELRMTEFVTGFSLLPDAGGVDDQSVWTMAMFEHFRSGENAVASKNLK